MGFLKLGNESFVVAGSVWIYCSTVDLFGNLGLWSPDKLFGGWYLVTDIYILSYRPSISAYFRFL